MYRKLYAVLMSLFLTMTVLPQSIYAEEETEEPAEEITETEEIQQDEEVIPEEIIQEETEESEEETVPEITEEPVIEETAEPETEQEEIIEEDPVQEEIIDPEPAEEIPEEPEEEITEEPIEETTESEPADAAYGDFEYELNDSGITITGYTGTDSEVVIPSEIDGAAVTEISEEAFSECTGLTKATIPDSVVTIKQYAFEKCSNLREVSLSGNLEKLDGAAFADCTSLTSITIPASLIDVDTAYYDGRYRGPFYGCTNLTEVTLEDGMEETPNNLFQDCSGLSTIIWPEGLAAVGEYTFEKCTGLTDITLPESITCIKRGAFSDCTGITEIVIPDSVTKIEPYAFEKCTNLANVTLSSNLEEIGGAAFADCTSLTSITIPASLRETDTAYYNGTYRGPFYGCTNLTEATLTDGMEEVANNLFQDCASLTTVNWPEDLAAIGEYSFEKCTGLTDIMLPESIACIKRGAFSGCTGITEIVIPDSVTKIEPYAFEKCTNLANVTLSSNLEEIGGAAFADCTSLTSIIFPASVSETDTAYYSGAYRGPFYGCTNLTEAILADGMETVANNLFQDCASLTIVHWPEGLRVIGESSFENCTGLTDITIPASVSLLRINAFSGCTGITEIVIPDSVTKIEPYAFEKCTNLSDVTLSSNLEEIGGAAFADCTLLTDITIPASVSYVNTAYYSGVYRGPFYGCTNLTEVTLSDGMEEVANNLFQDCASLTTVHWPEGLRAIGESSFENCTGLTDITIPASVSLLRKYAFSGCTGITEIVIPDSVTKIEPYAFEKCTNLSDVTLSSNLEEIGGAAFADCTSLTSITIPASVSYVNTAYYSGVYRGPFYGCTNLTEVTLSDGMETVANSLFQDCTALEIITIPASVTEIKESAFRNCTGLVSVIYPGSEDEWNQITIGTNNEPLGNAAFYFNGDKPVIMDKPVPPVLTAETAGHKSVHLSWTYDGNASLVSGFVLYRSFDGIEYHSVEVFGADETEYTDSMSFYGTSETISYKLKVYDKYGRSNISTVKTAEAVSTDTEAPVAVMSPSQLKYAAAGDTYYFSGGLSHDNDAVASWHWEFSDGASSDEEDVSHVFADKGTYTITLTVTDVNGLSNSASQTVRVIDLDDETEYTRLSLTVCNATNLEPVNNAQLIFRSGDFEDTLTAPDGTLEYILPNGEYTVGAFADGFISRTVKVIAEGGTQEHVIGLSTGHILSGSITTTEMTYDEIIDAGIDVNAPGNEHVYKFETALTFIAGLKEYELPIVVYKNTNNEVVGREGCTFDFEGSDSEFNELPSLQIYPITEKFVLIIYGEAHWLKEMYKVELFVNNDSLTDTIEQLSAELILPDGISLADMTDGVQSYVQQLGSLGCNENTRAVWYVRGDEEGEYNLTARVRGMTMPYGEFIEEEFTTSEPVKVYAGTALHMTITCPDVAERGEDYTVKFRLENVSDKSLYNLSFGITGMEQYKVIGYGDKESWINLDDAEFGEDWTHKVDELAPGGYIELAATTRIWFNSALELMKLVPRVGAFVDVAYYLTDVSVVTLSGSTTEIPYDIVVERAERDYLIDKIIDELVDKFLDENGVDIPGSLGDAAIELIGAAAGIDTTMISSAKTLLKLQRGQSNYSLEISVDDGRGAEDSIFNDYLSVSAGTDAQVVVDVLNGTKLKVTGSEVSFTATGKGNTKLKIGVINSEGKQEQEYVLDVNILDHRFGETVTVTKDTVTKKYWLDENEFTQKITEEIDQELDIYKMNPYLRINPKFTVEMSGQTSDSEYTIVMNTDSLQDLMDHTTVTDFELKGNPGSLTFPRDIVTALTASASQLEVTAESIQPESQINGALEAYYRFTINTENGEVDNFGGRAVSIEVPFNVPADITNPIVMADHIKDDGTVETLDAVYNAETGTVSFETTGFSTFRVYTDGISRIIDNAIITGITDQEWSGSEITQTPVVTFEGETLTEGTDYTVSYSDNTNVGTASVTITGKGRYTGTQTKEFTINPKSITPEVTLTTASYTYNGKAKTPGVTVKVGDTTLTKGTDYSVKYADGRTDAGTYNVKVTLKGNYKGTKTVSFTINKAAQSVTAKAAASLVSVGKTTTISVTGAQGKVTYSSANTAIATVSAAGKVTAKKVGTVKISVVSAATANYKKKTVTVTIKVVPAATTSITAANLATGIKVSWKKVTGAAGYYVYRNGTKIATIEKGTTVTYTDSKANTNGTKYTYKIVAYASTGTSKLSKSLVTYRVARPAISSLTNSAAGKMTVKWGKNAKAAGYQVQYSTTSTFDSYKTVTITSNTTVSKVIASLTKGKTYYVRVRSYKTVSSKKYYSMWSVVRKLKITK